MTTTAKTDKNQDVYEKYFHEYRDYSLNRPEIEILRTFKDRWPYCRMLDIGVGTGRTSYTFSAITKDYTGVDYAKNMVHMCKKIIGENESVRFHTCDARDLSRFYDQKFDFILFSLNGIDSVSHEDRLAILAEVRKVLKDNGYFFFSTHSIHSFPFKRRPPAFNRKRLPQSLYQYYRYIVYLLRMKYIYRNTDIAEVRSKPWAILNRGDHDFKMQAYHINPEYQLQQLRETGFNVRSIFNEYGKPLEPSQSQEAEWLYFLCEPAGGQNTVPDTCELE